MMTSRIILTATILIASLSMCLFAPPSALAQGGLFDELLQDNETALEEAAGVKEKARLHKERGDLFLSRDDLENAAEEFIAALDLYDGFSEEERVWMAVRISWAERYSEALDELRAILLENPQNIKARLHLARTLSWAGQYDEAIHEAEAVLENSPGNREALLVKANSLSWRGDPEQAIPIYEGLLTEEEWFNARLGLAHAHLARGNRRAAQESTEFLAPKYAYQEGELGKLEQALKKTTRPDLRLQYSYYNDSDDNRYDRYSALFSFWFHDFRADTRYTRTEARDNTRSNSTDQLGLSLYTKLTDVLGFGAGIGYAQADDGDDDYVTWITRADLDMLEGTLAVRASKDLFSETAEIIENRIRLTKVDIDYSRALTDRWFAVAGYGYTDYSDDNDSNQARFTIRYAVYPDNPRINVGYRFRYMDFARHSGGGYFDPHDLVSNQVFASLYYEKGKIYLYAEPYFGQQFFSRRGNDEDDLVAGGSFSIGARLSDDVTVEAFVEGGNFGLDTAAGFDYFMVGGKLKILF